MLYRWLHTKLPFMQVGRLEGLESEVDQLQNVLQSVANELESGHEHSQVNLRLPRQLADTDHSMGTYWHNPSLAAERLGCVCICGMTHMTQSKPCRSNDRQLNVCGVMFGHSCLRFLGLYSLVTLLARTPVLFKDAWQHCHASSNQFCHLNWTNKHSVSKQWLYS